MPLTRRRPQDKSERWQPRKSVRLYLDDIDEMLSVLRQTGGDVQAETEELTGTLVSADELNVAGQATLDRLSLSAGTDERGIRVHLFRPVMVRITPRDDLGLAGASQKVQAVLTARERRGGGWDRPTSVGVSMITGLLTAMILAFAPFVIGEWATDSETADAAQGRAMRAHGFG